MELYSPKAQKPENFRKNKVKISSVNVNTKSTLTDRTVIFEMKENVGRSNSKKRKADISILDALKMKFYEKLKIFFEYEEKFKEKENEQADTGSSRYL